MNKKLYFLHIPKTGGQTLVHNVIPALDFYNIKYYKNTLPPHTEDLNNNVFLSGHFGTYPLEYLSGYEVACIFRDPVERALSNFNYIYPILKDREEYYSINLYSDKLKYYLFEDPNFVFHRNTHARFICNSADPFIFNYEDWSNEPNRDKIAKHLMTRDWFIDNEKTNIEFAKKQIDSFKIVGTMENHKKFMTDVFSWFKENYGVGIPYNEEQVLNKSKTEYFGEVYETEDLKKMLSKIEYNRVMENNSLDYEVYEYVRNK